MPISSSCKLGESVKIHHPELVNIYGCIIGDDTHIGPFVEIQKNVVVGNKCKISSHSFICEGVEIEDEVFVGHGVVFINDIYHFIVIYYTKVAYTAPYSRINLLS